MSSPEEREKKRLRIKNHIKKDLRTPKYKHRVEEAPKKVKWADGVIIYEDSEWWDYYE